MNEKSYAPPLKGLRIRKRAGYYQVVHHTIDFRGEGDMTVRMAPKTFTEAANMIDFLHATFDHVNWQGDEHELYRQLTVADLNAIRQADRVYSVTYGPAFYAEMDRAGKGGVTPRND